MEPVNQLCSALWRLRNRPGELFVQEKPLSAYSEKERSRTIGVVLTDKTQAGGLTVYELVALGRQPHTGFFGRLNKTDHSIIEEALEAVSISHKAHSYTAELSDGERQKVMIAKAFEECYWAEVYCNYRFSRCRS